MHSTGSHEVPPLDLPKLHHPDREGVYQTSTNCEATASSHPSIDTHAIPEGWRAYLHLIPPWDGVIPARTADPASPGTVDPLPDAHRIHKTRYARRDPTRGDFTQ